MNVNASHQTDTEYDRCVKNILETFRQETAASFIAFCQKCAKSGYNIDGESLMDLTMNRLRLAFDRFRENFDVTRDQEFNEYLMKNYAKGLADFTEAAKKIITEKMKPKEKQKQLRFAELLKLNASDAVGKANGEQKPVINLNVTNKKNGSHYDESSLIVRVKMSSKNASCPMSGSTKRSRRAAKKCAKKPEMRIMLGKSSDSVSQQVTFTKDKSGTFSISSISIKKNDNLPTDNPSGIKINVTKNQTKTENVFKTATEEHQAKRPEQPTELIKYSCVHCHDANHWIQSFDAPKDVYLHWLTTHCQTTPVRPFQYFAIEYAACYHCNGKTIGTYNELIKHHKDCHRSDPFVIVNQNDHKKCALCPYNGLGIVAHFDTKHRTVLKRLPLRKVRAINAPGQLSSTVLEKRLESKVHQKARCCHCNIVRETERELRLHHIVYHKSTKLSIKEYYDDDSMYVLCSVCPDILNRNEYLSHIETHFFNFKCSHCDFTTNDMVKIVNHDKTHGLTDSFNYRRLQLKKRIKRDYRRSLVVFGNGFVTTKENLFGSKYDDSKEVNSFIESLMDLKKDTKN